ncbi:MAG: tRNA preQ1(34) S-adenosylmethionine ribosyltransferase-isomerase QueA [Patescibacteria group bacterium]
MTDIDLFDYELPKELIAQSPAEPRDHSRLMILDRQSGVIEHQQFFNIIDYIKEGDLLVMNDSKVFKARLEARVGDRQIEVFLLRNHHPDRGPKGRVEGSNRIDPSTRLRLARDGEINIAHDDNKKSLWTCLLKPGRKVKVGDELDFGEIKGVVQQKNDDGTVVIEMDKDFVQVLEFTQNHGQVPLPPYITKELDDETKYQTVYAKHVGSVAAPTAGFHFTPDLIENLKQKGIRIAYVTLHVGLGTFRPVKTQTLEEHEMHSEFVTISPETIEMIRQTKERYSRVIAVGTTSVRALEGAAPLESSGFTGDVNLFIRPGFEFQIVDAMITNFHLPKSTLLVLVSAFAGREKIIEAYKDAVQKKYRFFSFGDAMFIK